MVSVLDSGAIDRDFEPWLGKTKDYKIGICCLSSSLKYQRCRKFHNRCILSYIYSDSYQYKQILLLMGI
jgi:hypothetical protein